MLSGNINHYDQAFFTSEEQEKRKGGRFRTSQVYSSLGEVLDLSFCGALILKRRFRKVPIEETFSFKLRYAENSVVIDARVVRQGKRPGLGTLIALEFLGVTDEQRDAIKNIVRNSRCWHVIGFEENAA